MARETSCQEPVLLHGGGVAFVAKQTWGAGRRGSAGRRILKRVEVKGVASWEG